MMGLYRKLVEFRKECALAQVNYRAERNTAVMKLFLSDELLEIFCNGQAIGMEMYQEYLDGNKSILAPEIAMFKYGYRRGQSDPQDFLR